MAAVRSDAFYLNTGGGNRFCIFHQPDLATPCHGAVVHVHAFAEEMNKSRRMVALAARALAASGWAVLQIDLHGCGDSWGDFGEATWTSWIDDVRHAHRWASERIDGPRWLWGMRAGCLIAAEVSAQLGGQVPLLLWQPVLSGSVHLNQFLRLKLISEALSQAEARTGTKALRARLAEGALVEVAGYALNPSLAAGLERAELRMDAQLAPVVWREVGAEAQPQLAPASQTRLETLRKRGVIADATAVSGPLFWQTVEIAESPALVDATVGVLERFHANVD